MGIIATVSEYDDANRATLQNEGVMQRVKEMDSFKNKKCMPFAGIYRRIILYRSMNHQKTGNLQKKIFLITEGIIVAEENDEIIKKCHKLLVLEGFSSDYDYSFKRSVIRSWESY